MATINGWVQAGNNFVRKIGEKVYEVIRLEESDSNVYCIYYEYYDRVDLNNVTEETFAHYLGGLVNLDGFLAEKTEEAKAAYLAVHAQSWNYSYPCDNVEEVSRALKEDGIIPKEETLKLVFLNI